METDIELLQAAKMMQKDALVKIFDLYSPALFKYALRMCGDPLRADHVVGDVFAKLLEQFASGKGPTSNLRSYLYEMTYHMIVDDTRFSRRIAPLDAATALRQDGHSSLQLEDRIMFETLLKVIQDHLTDDQRHVIFLRFLEEFSLRETAEIMGKEISHVKVIQNRAIARLRKALEYNEVQSDIASSRIQRLSRVLSV